MTSKFSLLLSCHTKEINAWRNNSITFVIICPLTFIQGIYSRRINQDDLGIPHPVPVGRRKVFRSARSSIIYQPLCIHCDMLGRKSTPNTLLLLLFLSRSFFLGGGGQVRRLSESSGWPLAGRTVFDKPSGKDRFNFVRTDFRVHPASFPVRQLTIHLDLQVKNTWIFTSTLSTDRHYEAVRNRGYFALVFVQVRDETHFYFGEKR